MLSIFILSSIIHLYASYIDNSKLRNFSKPFILIGLLGWYCCNEYLEHGEFGVDIVVVLAIIFSLAGDILLIPKGNKWFAAGGISFGISHLFFSLAYIENIRKEYISLPVTIIVALVYIILVVLVFKGLYKYLPEKLVIPMYIYLLINGAMNCTAFVQLTTHPCSGTIITYIGAALFFASDSILFYTRFKKDSVWKNHFLVMLTYILAEFLIVQGLMMI